MKVLQVWESKWKSDRVSRLFTAILETTVSLNRSISNLAVVAMCASLWVLPVLRSFDFAEALEFDRDGSPFFFQPTILRKQHSVIRLTLISAAASDEQGVTTFFMHFS